ncbi:MAG: DUF47 family protein [archaeon]
MGLLNYTDEMEVYDLLSTQMDTVRDVIKRHYEVVEAFHVGKFSEIEKAVRATQHAEGIADGAKTAIRIVVSDNPFVPSFREDTLELAKKIENAADAAEASAKFYWITLDLLKKMHSKIPKKIKDNMLSLAKFAVDISAETHEGIKMLKGRHSDIDAQAKKVGEIEDRADAIEDETLKMVVDARLDAFLSIELISAIRLLANVVARCNSATHVMTYMRIARI